MIKAIVTDIEGTTSSLSFVKDTLFPYAREKIGEFVRSHADDPPVAALLNDVRAAAGDNELSIEEVVAQLERWIDEDRKATPLKALQGMIWEGGFRNGDFRGHVYADAEHALRAWRQQGLRLYVFSSGSVQAQKLLFGHSDYGDLTPLFDGYFDTRVGAKTETASYLHIAAAIGLAPAQILFLSDVEAELDAAHAAGMQTVWLVRDGEPAPGAGHRQVRDFSQITPGV